jgi:hypothetical protein
LIEKLRQSCALTLKLKHKKNLKWIYQTFGRNIKLFIKKNLLIKLPSILEVVNSNKGFSINKTLIFDTNKTVKEFISKLNNKNLIFLKCNFCNYENRNVEVQCFYLTTDFNFSINYKTETKLYLKMVNIYFITKRNLLPICHKHYTEYEKKELFLNTRKLSNIVNMTYKSFKNLKKFNLKYI